MLKQEFDIRLDKLFKKHNEFIDRKNVEIEDGNGIFNRYKYPVLTNAYIPITWKYDLDYNENPYLMERLGVNCVFNPGAIEINGKIYLVARVEGNDRKSFFAVAESKNGVDNFHFWDYPYTIARH